MLVSPSSPVTRNSHDSSGVLRYDRFFLNILELDVTSRLTRVSFRLGADIMPSVATGVVQNWACRWIHVTGDCFPCCQEYGGGNVWEGLLAQVQAKLQY